jgi:VWFA-related protein
VTPKLSLPALVALGLFAQTSAPEPPVNRVNSRLVEVNVIVHDKHGTVDNLTQRDFTLFDKGKEQTIASFLVAKAHAPLQPREPNVFTNRPDRDGSGDSITVILLDGLNTLPQDLIFVSSQFTKILNEIKPADRVAVYALGTRLRILSDIGSPTEDRQRIAEDWLADASVTRWLRIEDRLNNTAAALGAIAGHIGHLPGRKNLVWVAGSFPVSVGHRGGEGPSELETAASQQQTSSTGGLNRSPDNPNPIGRQVYQRLFEPAMQALVLNNISVYAADPRGLADLSAPDTTTTAGSGASRGRGQSKSGDTGLSAPAGANAVRTLAADTGGRVFEGSNEIQKGIRRAIDDAEVTYTLSYYPDSKSLDGNFRELKVQVTRKDLNLFYRKGYLALPEPKITEAQRVEAIGLALINPLSSGAIGLTAECEKSGQPKAGSMRAAVTISAGDLVLQREGGQWTGEIELILDPRSADGQDRGAIRRPLALKLTQAQYETALKQGISMSENLEPTGDVAEIRAVVSDRNSGKVGSLIMPVK